MKKIRQIHLYLGVLFAPSILFFALTGAFQTFRWQETGAAGALTPVLSRMAAIHKNSALETGESPEPRAEAAPLTQSATKERTEGKKPQSEQESNQPARRPSPLPLKIYVFLMSLGLIVSTATGVIMAFKYNRDRRLLWSLLIAGTVLPIGLLFI